MKQMHHQHSSHEDDHHQQQQTEKQQQEQQHSSYPASPRSVPGQRVLLAPSPAPVTSVTTVTSLVTPGDSPSPAAARAEAGLNLSFTSMQRRAREIAAKGGSPLPPATAAAGSVTTATAAAAAGGGGGDGGLSGVDSLLASPFASPGEVPSSSPATKLYKLDPAVQVGHSIGSAGAAGAGLIAPNTPERETPQYRQISGRDTPSPGAAPAAATGAAAGATASTAPAVSAIHATVQQAAAAEAASSDSPYPHYLQQQQPSRGTHEVVTSDTGFGGIARESPVPGMSFMRLQAQRSPEGGRAGRSLDAAAENMEMNFGSVTASVPVGALGGGSSSGSGGGGLGYSRVGGKSLDAAGSNTPSTGVTAGYLSGSRARGGFGLALSGEGSAEGPPGVSFASLARRDSRGRLLVPPGGGTDAAVVVSAPLPFVTGATAAAPELAVGSRPGMRRSGSKGKFVEYNAAAAEAEAAQSRPSVDRLTEAQWQEALFGTGSNYGAIGGGGGGSFTEGMRQRPGGASGGNESGALSAGAAAVPRLEPGGMVLGRDSDISSDSSYDSSGTEEEHRRRGMGRGSDDTDRQSDSAGHRHGEGLGQPFADVAAMASVGSMEFQGLGSVVASPAEQSVLGNRRALKGVKARQLLAEPLFQTLFSKLNL